MIHDELPTIHFTMEGIKTAVLHHMGVVGSDLGKELDKHIKKAIDTYDYQEQVSAIVHRALSEKIENFFRFGDGHKVLKETINEGLNKAFEINKGEEDL